MTNKSEENEKIEKLKIKIEDEIYENESEKDEVLEDKINNQLKKRHYRKGVLKYTGEDIINGLKEAYNRGLDIRLNALRLTDPPEYKEFLFVAAHYKQFFENFDELLNRAGFTNEDVLERAKQVNIKKGYVKGEKKYSKEDFIEGIRAAWEEGIDIRRSNINKNKEIRRFQWIATHFKEKFDKWDELLNEIELTREDVENRALALGKIVPRKKGDFIYTEEKLVAGVQEAWSKGYDIRYYSLSKTEPFKEYIWITTYYKRFFKNFDELLNKAGFTRDQLRERTLEIRKRNLLTNIKKAYDSGIDLSSKNLRTTKVPELAYYYTARSFYKGKTFWEDALNEAGIPAHEVVKLKQITKEKIKDFLIQQYGAGNKLNPTSLNSEWNAIMRAINTKFIADEYESSLEKALKYSGIDVENPVLREEYNFLKIKRHLKKVSRKGIENHVSGEEDDFSKIKRHVKKLLKKGKSLAVTDLDSKTHNYYKMILRRGHSWSSFLKAIDIKYESKHEKWTKQKLIEYIHEHYETGIVTTFGANETMRQNYVRHFGNIQNTVSEAKILYFPKGKISQEEISKKENIKILYDFNYKRIYKMAIEVYYNSKQRGFAPHTLANQAFLAIVEKLPAIPREKDIMEYMNEITKKEFNKILKQDPRLVKLRDEESVDCLEYVIRQDKKKINWSSF